MLASQVTTQLIAPRQSNVLRHSEDHHPILVTLSNGVVGEAGAGQLKRLQVEPDLADVGVRHTDGVGGKLEQGVIGGVAGVAEVGHLLAGPGQVSLDAS